MDQTEKTGKNEADAFAAQAQEEEGSFLGEFWDFLLHNKKWWLVPILVVLLLLGALVLAGSSAAAPFIYTLF